MKILVCVKQVPQLDHVRFDRANRIVREEVAAVCNPLDEQAVGQAVRLREATGGEIVAVTMGPPAAREVLEQAGRWGADRAIHLGDKRFKGADTLATARALAEIVRREEPDLVLFGRGTLDGATAQLGQQVAELSGLAQITEAVEVDLHDETATVRRETEYGHQSWQVPLPAAVTVARGPVPMPVRSGADLPLDEVTADDLGGAPTSYGTRGSPTFVREVRLSEAQPRRERVAVTEEAAERVAALVTSSGDADAPAEWSSRAGPAREVWVLVEHDGAHVDTITFEGLACARDLAEDLDARVSAVLLAATDVGVSGELAARGADRVLHVRHPQLATYATAAYTDALTGLLGQQQPDVLIAPWTVDGRDYAPRVAARLGLGLTGDVTGVEVEPGDQPRIGWIKPAWAGTAHALVVSRTTPTVATLRPGAYAPLRHREDVTALVDTVDVDITASPRDPRPVGSSKEVEHCRLDRAAVVLCLGSELTTEAAAQAVDLAEKWQAGIGGTAEAVRRGLVPPQWELGILKRSIAPRVCVALGVRDAQDTTPVRGARELVTVHPDPRASAHERADLQLVTDVPSLIKALAGRS